MRRLRSPATTYDGLVDELIQFLDGDTAPVLDRLDKQMHEASDELEFERAARLRDQIVSVRKAIERQQMVDAKEEDYDAIGIADDPLEASVQVFLVRKGRVVGRKGIDRRQGRGPHAAPSWSAGCSSSSTAASTPPTSRARSWFPTMPDDVALYEEFLASAARQPGAGSGCPSAAPSGS